MKAAEGSKRLERTLQSEAFAYKDSVSAIVRNQLLRSGLVDADSKPDAQDWLLGGKHYEVAQHWSKKVTTFLDDLRSVSATHAGKPVTTDDHHGSTRDWNLKDESDAYRVLYREGPVGTPFHTLCLDGVVNGDFASGLCVAWESPMFKEWWPQATVPTFKITESKWLRRIRVGEDLSLIRFKVPWPLAPREVLMSAFELEYFQEDLVIGLIESVPEAGEINEEIHGYCEDDVPRSSSTVRIDITGGFVMQRTSKDQFFFRTIMNMDMKLDFVPPWLINFVSRQLAGQGLKLYQKAVLAVSNNTGHGKAFQKPLKTEKMYERVRSGLEEKRGETVDQLLPVGKPMISKENLKTKPSQGSIRRMGSSESNRVVPFPVKVDEAEEVVGENDTSSVVEPIKPLSKPPPLTHKGKLVTEISPDIAGSSNQISPKSKAASDNEVRAYEDPEVQWALSILDKAISFTQSYAAEPASAATGRRERKRESSSNIDLDPRKKELHVTYSRKPPLPPVKTHSDSVVNQASAPKLTEIVDNRESVTSSGTEIVGTETESSEKSGFWSASEIEIVSSQDDTDTDPGASGRLPGQSKAEEPREESSRQRGRRWHWTCFSPREPRKTSGGPGYFSSHDKLGLGNYSRDARRHGKSAGEKASRFRNDTGFITEGDEPTARRGLVSEDYLPDRSLTLGEMLMDN